MTIGNLKISTRLGFGFGSVLILLSLIIVMGIHNLSKMNNNVDELVKRDWVKANLANLALDYARGSITRLFQSVAATEEKEIAEAEERLLINTAGFDDALAKLEPLLIRPEGKALLAKAQDSRNRYVASYGKVQVLRKEGKHDEASKLAYGDTYKNMQEFGAVLHEMTAFQQKIFETTGVEAAQTFSDASKQMIALGILAVVIGLGFAFWLTRSITRPINMAVKIAQTVATGDLTSKFDVTTNDETGLLLQALKAMNDSLAMA